MEPGLRREVAMLRTFITLQMEPSSIGSTTDVIAKFNQLDGIIQISNPQKNEFIIEEPEKSLGESYNGQVYGFNEATSDIRFEGALK